jgi:septum formation protein
MTESSEASPPPPRIILASASPRRQQLLQESGYTFDVVPANIDENRYPPELTPVELARHLAFEKANAVSRDHPDAIVIGADTLVVFGDTPLGKPADPREARRMLALLSGTTHIVITGVTLLCPQRDINQTRSAMSAVRMRKLLPIEIDAYVESNQWQGKAGGYGIQDPDPFVIHMSGPHSNIVGLPMELTAEMLAEVGVFPKM